MFTFVVKVSINIFCLPFILFLLLFNCVNYLFQVLSDIDTVLFSLLILKSLTNSKGNIWQCLPVQYYVVEVTYMDLKLKGKGRQMKELLPSTMSLLKLLPTVNCLSPLKVLQRCKSPKTAGNSMID